MTTVFLFQMFCINLAYVQILHTETVSTDST
ncbi:hypothetical protein GLYMA_19G251650v4 [Glycine max]|nr:hypothetical protein GLYMA_19G251650v4 [Glycine max]KAH1079505.1 hypothetical protein GYH30_054184 [Glycine max]